MIIETLFNSLLESLTINLTKKGHSIKSSAIAGSAQEPSLEITLNDNSEITVHCYKERPAYYNYVCSVVRKNREVQYQSNILTQLQIFIQRQF